MPQHLSRHLASEPAPLREALVADDDEIGMLLAGNLQDRIVGLSRDDVYGHGAPRRQCQGFEQAFCVSTRCGLADAKEPVLQDVAAALDALEELRRVLSHSGQDATREASRVRDQLSAAREKLKLRH